MAEQPAARGRESDRLIEAARPPLRIVAWNCHQGLARKSGPILELAPDVAIIAECGQELELGSGALVRVGWTGRSPTKGLGLFVDPRLAATVDPAWDAEREWFLPIHLGGDTLDLDVIGVWAMNHRGKESGPKLGRTLRALKAYSAILERGRSIIAGDFNDNGRWDTPRQASFKDTVAFLHSLGYVSLYHARTGESHGGESAASLYWYRHRDRPYLVDHAFMPEVWLSFVRTFELGDPDQWLELSDHVPLVIELDVPAAYRAAGAPSHGTVGASER